MLALSVGGAGSSLSSVTGSVPIGWLGSPPHHHHHLSGGGARMMAPSAIPLQMTSATTTSTSSSAAAAEGSGSAAPTAASSTELCQYLATTERLLQMLQVLPPTTRTGVVTGGGDDRRGGSPPPGLLATMDQHEQLPDVGTKTTDDEAEEEQEEEIDINNIKLEEADVDDDDDVNNAFYQTLQRTENLSTAILTALDDIRCWRHRSSNHNTTGSSTSANGAGPTTTKTKKRMSLYEIRADTLERQREMLLQQQKQKQEQEQMIQDAFEAMMISNVESNEDLEVEVENADGQQGEDDDNDDDAEDLENEEEGDDNDNNNCEQGQDSSWHIAQRTFQSLQALTPILLRLLRHPRRGDPQIQIGALHIRPTKRRTEARVWLFSEHVYDVCTKKDLERMMERLSQIYLMLGLGKTVFNDDDDETSSSSTTEQLIGICQDTVETTIQHARALHNEVSSSPLLAHEYPLPFDGLANAEQMYTFSHELDAQYDMTKPLNDNAKSYEQYQTSIRNLHSTIARHLSKRFPRCRLSLYGSCLSDLALGKNADVDLSLTIPEMVEAKRQFEAGDMSAAIYQNSVKKQVFLVSNLLGRRSENFANMVPVARARVPVIKGRYTSTTTESYKPYNDSSSSMDDNNNGGALDFDICFLNDIAVANSGLIREYSLVDVRIKQLMIAVKRWAKGNGLASAQDAFLSSYAWMNLVVFYILSLGLAPNLQSKKLAEKVVGRRRMDQKSEWHSVNNLDTFYLKWEDVASAPSVWQMPDRLTHLSVTSLLYGFFRFYAEDFRGAIAMVSIKRVGNSDNDAPAVLVPMAKWKGFRRLSMFLSIEDPFETHDSHMPHDLGQHAGDGSTVIIMERFHAAKDHLFRILTNMAEQKSNHNNKNGEQQHYLWPVVERQMTRNGQNGNNTQPARPGRNRRQPQQNTTPLNNGQRRDQRGRGGGRNKPNGTNNNKADQTNRGNAPNPKAKPLVGDQARKSVPAPAKGLQSQQKDGPKNPADPSAGKNNRNNARRNQGRQRETTAESQNGGSANVAVTQTAKTTSESSIGERTGTSTTKQQGDGATSNASTRNSRPRNPRSNDGGANDNRVACGTVIRSIAEAAQRKDEAAQRKDEAVNSNSNGINTGTEPKKPNNRRRNPPRNRRGPTTSGPPAQSSLP
jgi:Cid1 family poly A polymerase